MKTANKIMMPNGELIALSGASFEMFDTVLKDHILTFEQTKGWALQGTYVYKEAVAGSRYGYPDFYNKCVEEKDLGTPTETVLGDNTVTLYVNSNGHTFYDISDKEAIDAWYSTYGIAWYYGIDKENERVFLPRTKWFMQPSGEVTEVNTVNEAGLPNITGDTSGIINRSSSVTASGALSASSSKLTFSNAGGYNGSQFILSLDASRSSAIYGNSDTVQPPSINQLLYICVGNTNVESAVTDVVDVTTTENDTVPLGYSTYQNGIQPNTSWLKSEGQWNDGNVYTTFYNEFVQKIGQSFASGYVKEITDEYDDYDLVINQDDMTFRLPLLDGSETLPEHSNSRSFDDGVEYTAEQNGFIYATREASAGNVGTDAIIVINGIAYKFHYFNSVNGAQQSSIFIPIKRGDIYKATNTAVGREYERLFIPSVGNGSLYFKVANAVQNLELLDAGEVLEAVNNVVPDNKELITGWSFPSDKYINLTLGASGATYTAPANGWFNLVKVTGIATHTYLDLTIINNARLGIRSNSNGSASTVSAIALPCRKGDVISSTYNLTGETKRFRFIYAEGEI